MSKSQTTRCAVCGCRLPAGSLVWRRAGRAYCLAHSPWPDHGGEVRHRAAGQADLAGFPSVWAMVAAFNRPRPGADSRKAPRPEAA
mgnify:CR=1 FL=1